jgi:hypothetical protein
VEDSRCCASGPPELEPTLWWRQSRPWDQIGPHGFVREVREVRCEMAPSAPGERWHDACEASAPWESIDSSPASPAADMCESPNRLVRFANRHFRRTLPRPSVRRLRGFTSAGPLSMHSARPRSRLRPPARARKAKRALMLRKRSPWKRGMTRAYGAQRTRVERRPTKGTTGRRWPCMVDLHRTKRSSGTTHAIDLARS